MEGHINLRVQKGGMLSMTKRNQKTKSGLQSTKSINEFSNELKPQNKKAEKTRPN